MQILAVAAVLASGGVGIDARTDCPSSQAVAEQLHALTGDVEAAPGERVELWRDGERVYIRLKNAQGVLAERTLPSGNCAELASAVAVVVAAWRTEVGASTPRLQ